MALNLDDLRDLNFEPNFIPKSHSVFELEFFEFESTDSKLQSYIWISPFSGILKNSQSRTFEPGRSVLNLWSWIFELEPLDSILSSFKLFRKFCILPLCSSLFLPFHQVQVFNIVRKKNRKILFIINRVSKKCALTIYKFHYIEKKKKTNGWKTKSRKLHRASNREGNCCEMKYKILIVFTFYFFF